MFDVVGGFDGDAEVVLYHELDEFGAVDEDDAASVESVDIVVGGLAEFGGGDKDALLGFLPLEGTDEFLDFGAADGGVAAPAFGLNVDGAEAELVFADDAVDAFISALAGDATGAFQFAAVAHALHKLHYQHLEEVEILLQNGGEQLILQRGVDLVDGVFNGILRRGVVGGELGRFLGFGRARFRLSAAAALEGDEARVVAQRGVVYFGELSGKQFFPFFCDLVDAALGVVDEPRFFQVGTRPADAPHEHGFAVAVRQEHAQIFIGNLQHLHDVAAHLLAAARLPVCRIVQEDVVEVVVFR